MDFCDVLVRLGLRFPSSIVQIGASGGNYVDDFYRMGIEEGIFIEPLDIPFQMLRQHIAKYEKYVAVKALIHDSVDADVWFHVSSNFGASSSILEPTKHLSMYPDVTFPKTITLTPRTLIDVLGDVYQSRESSQLVPEALFLDTQGTELCVLRSLGFQVRLAKYIWSEIGDGSGYKDATTLQSLYDYLRSFNFELCYLLRKPNDFGDALFINRNVG